MELNKISGKKYISSLKAIHYGLVISIILFLLVLLSITEPVSRNEIDLSKVNIFFLILGVFSLTGVIVGEITSRKQIDKAKSKILLIEKANLYLLAKIRKYSMLEAPALLAIAFYMLIPVRGFVFIAVSLLTLMIIAYPSKERLIQELELNSDEKKIFDSSEKLMSDQKINNI